MINMFTVFFNYVCVLLSQKSEAMSAVKAILNKVCVCVCVCVCACVCVHACIRGCGCDCITFVVSAYYALKYWSLLLNI